MSETAESIEEKRRREDQSLAQKWLAEIERRRSKERKWRDQAKKVIARYRDDRAIDNEAAKFNILWSNTETIKPAIFSRMPVVDVRRRWTTKDNAARTAALILERSLTFINAAYNFKDVLNRANEDYVLPGRSVAVVCYEPLLVQKRKAVEPLPPSNPPEEEPKYPEGTLQDEQGAYRMEEYKAWESVYAEYVPWDLFGFSECKTWQKVPAMWIGDYMTREDIEEIAPEFTDWNNLNFKQSSNDDDKDNTQPPQTLLVWKIWHKASRKFLVVAEGYTTAPLTQVDDPTELECFFPIVEPMYSLRNNGSWTPKPEFLLYQDQANELDIIAARMQFLIQACKNRGVYDQAMDKLAKISELPKKGDNEFIPVPNFRELADKGGLEALLSAMPLQNIVECIAQLRERETELKAQIYEIYGIADIMRGASEASETLGAQQLKAQYGALRISTRQERFQEFIRDIYRIQAELIAEHFDPDTLRIMCGLQVMPDIQYEQLKQQKKLEAGTISETEFNQAIQIIRSDKLRGFKVDIETDSTVPVDRKQEQDGRVAFMSAVGQYLQGVIPAVQEGAIPISVAREGLLFVVRGFKVGTELEEVLDELGQDDGDSAQQASKLQKMVQVLQQQLQEMQQENQALKADSAVEMKKAQDKAAIDQQSAQQDSAIKAQEAQQNSAIETDKANREAALREREAEHQAMLDERKALFEQQLAQQQAEFEMQLKLKEAEHSMSIKSAEAEQKSELAKTEQEGKDVKPSLEKIESALQEAIEHLNAPSEIVRDDKGSPIGIKRGKSTKSVIRGPDGAIVGMQ